MVASFDSNLGLRKDVSFDLLRWCLDFSFLENSVGERASCMALSRVNGYEISSNLDQFESRIAETT
jgi:hypothetical protein